MKAEKSKSVSEVERATFRYFDAIDPLERKIEAVARLAQGCTDPERAQPEVIAEIGTIIVDYLRTKRIYDHFFFDRTIDDHELENPEAKATLYTLDERFGER